MRDLDMATALEKKDLEALDKAKTKAVHIASWLLNNVKSVD